MVEGFSLSDEQRKAFDEILSSNYSINSAVTRQSQKFDAFNALIGSDRVLTDLKSKLPFTFSGQALINCDPANSKEVLIALTKFALTAKTTPVLVLFNYNYKTILSELKKSSVSGGFVILDTVSKNISHVDDSKELIFVDSLRNLTQIQIKMINLIESNQKVTFIFDSLSMLDLYHEEEIVTKFVYSVTRLLKKHSSGGFYISAGKTSPAILQFFDENIELKKYL